MRTRELTPKDARTAFATLDTWAARTTRRLKTTSVDVSAVEIFLRRLDLTLLTPDALNIAICQRAGAVLATL